MHIIPILIALIGGYSVYCIAFSRIKLKAMPAPEFYAQSESLNFDPSREQTLTKHDFPIGWYQIMDAKQLKPCTTYYAHYLGEHLAFFRAKDGTIYAVDAYCPHLGANLGTSGKVNNHTIECGFHGWTFDGKTGLCTNHSTARSACFKAVNGQCKYVIEDAEQEVRIRTWIVREVNGMIFLWFHPKGEKPMWEPYRVPEIDNGKAHYRGEGIAYTRTNIRDVRENASDIAHFRFVHRFALNFTTLFKLIWEALPFFFDGKEDINAKLNELPKKYRELYTVALRNANQNASYMLFLTTFFKFGHRKIPIFDIAVIQVGPGQATANVSFHWLPKITSIILFNLVPVNGTMQKTIHRIYCPWYVPYWVSSLFLRSEFNQVLNDSKMWNYKLQTEKHLLSNIADNYFISWRQWFTKFYAAE